MDGPEVTVSDPAQPRGPGELIEARESWRPSRRLVLMVSAVAAGAVAVGAGLRVADSRGADQRAASSLAAVHLAAQLDGVTTNDQLVTATVAVLVPRAGNPRPAAGLSIVGATVGDGWSLGSSLTPGAARLATIELSRTVSCTAATATQAAVARAVPEPVLGLVLAQGSQRRQVRLTVPPVAPEYAQLVLSACGGAGDAEAVGSSTLVPHRVGDHLEADLLLTNDSDRVVRLVGVGSEGLAVRVTDPLPVLLPARPFGRRSGPLRVTRVHLVLAFTQCVGSGQIVAGALTETTGLQLQLGRQVATLYSPRLRQLQVQLVLERCRRRS